MHKQHALTPFPVAPLCYGKQTDERQWPGSWLCLVTDLFINGGVPVVLLGCASQDHSLQIWYDIELAIVVIVVFDPGSLHPHHLAPACMLCTLNTKVACVYLIASRILLCFTALPTENFYAQ